MTKRALEVWNKICGEILRNFRGVTRKKRRSRVKFDSWGGTSVNPSEVFRSERGKEDLEFFARLTKNDGES